MTEEEIVVLARDYVNSEDRIRTIRDQEVATRQIHPEREEALARAELLTQQVYAMDEETLSQTKVGQRLSQFRSAYNEYGRFLWIEQQPLTKQGKEGPEVVHPIQYPNRDRKTRRELAVKARRAESKLRRALV